MADKPAEEPAAKKAKLTADFEEQEDEEVAYDPPAGEDQATAEISAADAEWLLEDGGSRVRRFEMLISAEAKVEPSGQVQFGCQGPGGEAWAKQCLLAFNAMRTSSQFPVPELPAEEAGWNPPMSTMDIPKDVAEGHMLGGNRLPSLADGLGVVAAFANAKDEGDAVDEKEEEEPIIKIGDLREAKYGNKDRWFEVEIVEIEGDKVKVKWTYDEEQPIAELAIGELKPKKEAERPKKKAKTTKTQPIKEGAEVEAKFSNGRWFDAKVTKVSEGKVWVKWDYDPDVPQSELALDDVKGKPMVQMLQLRLYGEERGRMVLELKIRQLVDSKAAGCLKAPETDTCKGVGWSIIPLIKNGEFKAKVIGKGGSVRIRIGKACGSELEYIGNDAYIVGTLEQRQCTEAMLELLQIQGSSALDSVPEALKTMCTQLPVPAAAGNAIMGKGRATMNQLEDEAGALTFWGPASEQRPCFSQGDKVEGRYETKKGERWFEAKVLEVTEDGKGGHTLKVRWDYDESLESDLPEADVRKPGSEAGEKDKSLFVFGPDRSRKTVELRTMTKIEEQCPGTFQATASEAEGDDFGVHVFQLPEGAKLKDGRCPAISKAAHCILEQVGNMFHMAGVGSERAAGQTYLRWLCEGKTGLADGSEPENVEKITVPEEKMANYVDWQLEKLEEDTSTFIFVEKQDKDENQIFVGGLNAKKRAEAVSELTRLKSQEVYTPRTNKGQQDEEKQEKKKVVYVVNQEEEERRKKRAARFGN